MPAFGFGAWDMSRKAVADNKQTSTTLLGQAEVSHLLKSRVADRYIYPQISPEWKGPEDSTINDTIDATLRDGLHCNIYRGAPHLTLLTSVLRCPYPESSPGSRFQVGRR